MAAVKSRSPGRYAGSAKAEPIGKVSPIRAGREGWDERVEQLEGMLHRHETMLRQLMGATDAIREKLEQMQPASARRQTPREMPALNLVPMKDEDMMIGGQYLFRVANPRRPFYARAVITNNPKEDPKTGVLLYPFVRGDTTRSFQPRPASEFFKLPQDWKDPAEDTGEEDEGSSRPATSRPQSNKSTRPERSGRA